MMKHINFGLAELVLVFAAILTPLFLLANEIDGDEWLKGTFGALLGGAVIAIQQAYKVWKTGQR